jgi:hypothetical protein
MKVYFDLLITLFLFITAVPAVILLYEIKKPNTWETKHKKVTVTLSIILLLGTSTIIYGSFIEPKILIVNKQEIDLPKIEKPIKIVFIADLQTGPYRQTKYSQKVVNKIKELKPDLIIFGGDLIDNNSGQDNEIQYLKPFAELTKNIPFFAINGNHEYGVGHPINMAFPKTGLVDKHLEVENAMTKLGVDYLTNELRTIIINGQSLQIFGGDSSFALKLDFSALKNRDSNLPLIAVLHDPLDVYTGSTYKPDLILSGHTHGGQIRLPFFGPIGRMDLKTPTAWYKGWSEYKGVKFFVTSGLGETGVRARLFNPPEIVLLTLK